MGGVMSAPFYTDTPTHRKAHDCRIMLASLEQVIDNLLSAGDDEEAGEILDGILGDLMNAYAPFTECGVDHQDSLDQIRNHLDAEWHANRAGES